MHPFLLVAAMEGEKLAANPGYSVDLVRPKSRWDRAGIALHKGETMADMMRRLSGHPPEER